MRRSLGHLRDRVIRIDDDVAIHYRALGVVEKAWLQARGLTSATIAAALAAKEADGGDTAAALRAGEAFAAASAELAAALLRVMVVGVEGIDDAEGRPIELRHDTQECLGVAVPLADARTLMALSDLPELQEAFAQIVREGTEALIGLGERSARDSAPPPPTPGAHESSGTSRDDAATDPGHH